MDALRTSARALGALLRETGDALASLFLAAPCRVCGEVLAAASALPICRECLRRFTPIPEPLCAHCGRPMFSTFVGQGSLPLCHLCRKEAYAFDRARSFAVYDERMVRAITLLKYHQIVPLGTWFGERLAELVRAGTVDLAADVVVPVPLHPSRLRERGYNQAELIARPLARRLRLPLRSYLLVRTKPRPDKLKLSRAERWRTVRGAYAMRAGSQVDNLRVLLVDDVFTTGATLDACARALRRAGARSVFAVTVARAVPAWTSQQDVPEQAWGDIEG